MQTTKNKKIFFSAIILFLFLVNCFLGFSLASAQDINKLGKPSELLKKQIGELKDPVTDQSVTLGKADLPELVGEIIYGVLGFLGIICLILVIYAGLMWMTAEGNEEKVTEAKGILRGVIIGVIIIVISYAVTYFVVTRIIGSTQPTTLPGQSSGVEVRPQGDYRGGEPSFVECFYDADCDSGCPGGPGNENGLCEGGRCSCK